MQVPLVLVQPVPPRERAPAARVVAPDPRRAVGGGLAAREVSPEVLVDVVAVAAAVAPEQLGVFLLVLAVAREVSGNTSTGPPEDGGEGNAYLYSVGRRNDFWHSGQQSDPVGADGWWVGCAGPARECAAASTDGSWFVTSVCVNGNDGLICLGSM